MCLFLLVIPLISPQLIIEDTTFRATQSNYTIYINQSITLDKMTMTTNSIEFYNSSKGKFENPNQTYSSQLSFFGLKAPNNDIRLNGGIIIKSNVEDTIVSVPTNGFIEVGDFPIELSLGGGGGGITTELKELIVDDLSKRVVYNETFNITFETLGMDSRHYDFIDGNFGINIPNYANLTIEKSALERISQGTYTQKFRINPNINTTQTYKLKFMVFAKGFENIIEKEVEITLKNKEFFTSFFDDIVEHKGTFLFTFIFVCVGIVILNLNKRKKEREAILILNEAGEDLL